MRDVCCRSVQRVILSEARTRAVEPVGRHEVSGSLSVENKILELVWQVKSPPQVDPCEPTALAFG